MELIIMNKNVKVVFNIITSVMFFGIALYIKSVDSFYFRLKIASKLNCDPEIVDVIFWVFIILGIVDLIVAIVVGASNSNNNSQNINTNYGTYNNAPVQRRAFVVCPNCGESNGANNTKCFKCGNPLVYTGNRNTVQNNQIICSKCGTANPGSSRFCSNCSNRLQSPPVQAANSQWKCPNCGRINQDYVGTCGCGQVKP